MSDSLTQIGVQLLRIIIPVIIIAGVVSNLMNIAVLTRPTLHYHACSRYFLALAINNLFYSSIPLTNDLLGKGYGINLSNYSTISCKIFNYIIIVNAFISPYLIVLASINRYCTTSRNAQIRKFSGVRVTKWMIFMMITFVSLFLVNVLVLLDLQGERGFSCAFIANSMYSQVYIITQVFLFAAVPPSLMIIFGLMTIHNSKRIRVVPFRASRFNRTEHQLTRMLFLQVGVHILLTLPLSITYLLLALPNTIQYTTIFSFIFTILLFFFDFSYVTPFFLYVLSGRIYRIELLRLVRRIFRIRRGNAVEPRVNRNIVLPVKSLVPLTTIA